MHACMHTMHMYVHQGEQTTRGISIIIANKILRCVVAVIVVVVVVCVRLYKGRCNNLHKNVVDRNDTIQKKYSREIYLLLSIFQLHACICIDVCMHESDVHSRKLNSKFISKERQRKCYAKGGKVLDKRLSHDINRYGEKTYKCTNKIDIGRWKRSVRDTTI